MTEVTENSPDLMVGDSPAGFPPVDPWQPRVIGTVPPEEDVNTEVDHPIASEGQAIAEILSKLESHTPRSRLRILSAVQTLAIPDALIEEVQSANAPRPLSNLEELARVHALLDRQDGGAD